MYITISDVDVYLLPFAMLLDSNLSDPPFLGTAYFTQASHDFIVLVLEFHTQLQDMPIISCFSGDIH